ncbi:sugar-binding domain-containing protein [Flavobacterium sp. 3-210]
MDGYDIPIYTNITYPFPKNPPFIAGDYNPVASYRRSFTVSDSWNDKEIILHFGPISGYARVFLNGKVTKFNVSQNGNFEWKKN